MQAAMLPFPYSFPCQPYIDTSECVTSSSPLSSPASGQTANNLAARCYDSIVTTRFRSHEQSASSKFTGLVYDGPKGFTPPVRKLFTIEAILGLNEDKSSKTSVPIIYTSSAETKDSPPAVYTSHSSLHLQQPSSVTSSTSPSSKPCAPSVHHQKLPAGGGKMKRIRTIFTPEQLERLELEFERQQYMVGPERMYLASSLGLSESQVKVWFQNRRIKFRKQHLEMQQARLAQLRESGEETDTDYPSKEVTSTHWDDIRDMMEDRN